ncbi:MAG: phosphohistidine phosphatase SixA [Gammaproteobacteria bacterium]|jgi:phosphohistidine phosphatase SixA
MLIQSKLKLVSGIRPSVLVLLIYLSLTGTGVLADSHNNITDEALISALRSGGFNLYFRHEATNWSQSDDIQQFDDWLSCDGNQIRQLSNEGRENATNTGQSISKLGIPVGLVFASPYCRTVETARLMQQGKVQATTEVMNLRVAEYFGGRNAIVKSARALLARNPDTGTNNIIVAHGNVAQAATPIYPGEGEAVIFRPDGKGGFSVTGRLTPQDWDRLSKSVEN